MILNANALAIPLADQSVQCVVTSPPYYGLRDYGTAKWEGGDPNCDHVQVKRVSLESGLRNDGRKHKGLYEGEKVTKMEVAYRQVCGKCGAIRIDEQIGLEQTPDEYVANLVAVFRECKRILRDDGTLWVNIGDSYARDPAKVGNGHPSTGKQATNKGSLYEYQSPIPDGVKQKDLIGIPWMLAFALRADGWYLRQDIIWAKPNPMPESVKDRCTKSHEYIFLLSKSARYYYDHEAVKEPAKNDSGWAKQAEKGKRHQDHKAGSIYLANREESQYGLLTAKITPDRNKRDVWTVTTKPYKGAHYATFNPELIKPCILAGAPETCCAKCGAPYERVTERVSLGKRYSTGKSKEKNESGLVTGFSGYDDGSSSPVFKTIGFEPTCTCNAGTSSGIVFDPFVGSGTTVATAIQLGRKGIGLDLSLTYLYENAKDRIKAEMLPLLTLIKQSETQEQK